MAKRNSSRGDAAIRRLERQVLSGDLTAVSALAAAYERAGRGREVTSVVLREDEPPFAVLLFEHQAGMEPEDVVEAARRALREGLAAKGRTVCWGDVDALGPEEWSKHGLVMLDTTRRTETVDRWEDLEVESERVDAEVHTDDGSAEAEFDAAPWLRQATGEEIRALAECGWRGDYPADAVAEWTQDIDADVRAVFRRVRRRSLGFECSVDEEQARHWLEQNRPDVAATLPATDGDEDD